VTGPVLSRRDADALPARLGALRAWRRGARLGLAVAPVAAITGLLAHAVAAGVLVAATLLAAVVELAARRELRDCALDPELGGLPAVAPERARLSDAAHRRRLAGELRTVAGLRIRTPREDRLVPHERLAAARRGLLGLADDLEAAEHADPALLAEIHALLRDGTRSPLLNADLPAEELPVALRRARFRLATDRPPEPAAAGPAHGAEACTNAHSRRGRRAGRTAA
jgi:hypothetical protein